MRVNFLNWRRSFYPSFTHLHFSHPFLCNHHHDLLSFYSSVFLWTSNCKFKEKKSVFTLHCVWPGWSLLLSLSVTRAKQEIESEWWVNIGKGKRKKNHLFLNEKILLNTWNRFCLHREIMEEGLMARNEMDIWSGPGNSTCKIVALKTNPNVFNSTISSTILRKMTKLEIENWMNMKVHWMLLSKINRDHVSQLKSNADNTC